MDCYLEIITQPIKHGYKFRCKSDESINDDWIRGENGQSFPVVMVI